MQSLLVTTFFLWWNDSKLFQRRTKEIANAAQKMYRNVEFDNFSAPQLHVCPFWKRIMNTSAPVGQYIISMNYGAKSTTNIWQNVHADHSYISQKYKKKYEMTGIMASLVTASWLCLFIYAWFEVHACRQKVIKICQKCEKNWWSRVK